MEINLLDGLKDDLMVLFFLNVEDGFVLLVLGLLVHVYDASFGTVG